jgi:hypothetical protein
MYAVADLQTAVIERFVHPPDLPRSYPHLHIDEGWTDADWERVPVVTVPIWDLVPSQQGLDLRHLANYLNDPDSRRRPGRAIRYDGQLNLHDGHHRWLLDLVEGATTFEVRIVDGNHWRPVNVRRNC